jgi:hypothetical protein
MYCCISRQAQVFKTPTARFTKLETIDGKKCLGAGEGPQFVVTKCPKASMMLADNLRSTFRIFALRMVSRIADIHGTRLNNPQMTSTISGSLPGASSARARRSARCRRA